MKANDLSRLRAVGGEARVPTGQVLIERGQHGSGLYVVLEGTVVVEAPDGIFEFGAGTIIGQRALFSADGRRAARVRAATDVRVLAVERTDFERLCRDDPEFARRLANLGA
jgi:CRP-like cAMP-binding protein